MVHLLKVVAGDCGCDGWKKVISIEKRLVELAYVKDMQRYQL